MVGNAQICTLIDVMSSGPSQDPAAGFDWGRLGQGSFSLSSGVLPGSVPDDGLVEGSGCVLAH